MALEKPGKLRDFFFYTLSSTTVYRLYQYKEDMYET